jgi:hypothetical protein
MYVPTTILETLRYRGGPLRAAELFASRERGQEEQPHLLFDRTAESSARSNRLPPAARVGISAAVGPTVSKVVSDAL